MGFVDFQRLSDKINTPISKQNPMRSMWKHKDIWVALMKFFQVIITQDIYHFIALVS